MENESKATKSKEYTAEEIMKMSLEEQYEKRVGEFVIDDNDGQIQYLEERWSKSGRRIIDFDIPPQFLAGWFHEPITNQIPLPRKAAFVIGRAYCDAKTIGIIDREKIQPDPNYKRIYSSEDVLRNFPIVFRYDKESDKDGRIMARPLEILNSKPLLDVYTFLYKELSKNEAFSIITHDLPYNILEEELKEIDWEYKCIDVAEKSYKLGLNNKVKM